MTTTETAGFVCLYFGSGEDCWNCGGWLKAAGGPFDGDSRYCSEDCFADAQERVVQYAQRVACCPECGYDNQEHAPKCGSTNLLCPGGCGCRLGTDDADRFECGCDETCDAEAATVTTMPDGTTVCRCVVCPRCGHHTGNSHQGHHWGFCTVTRTVRTAHYCCGNEFGCELEPGSGDSEATP